MYLGKQIFKRLKVLEWGDTKFLHLLANKHFQQLRGKIFWKHKLFRYLYRALQADMQNH